MKILDIIFFISILVVSLICFVFGESILLLFAVDISNVFVVGIYFAIVSVSVIFFTHIVVFVLSPIKKYLPSRDVFVKSICNLGFLALIVSFVLGCAFQFFYSIGGKKLNKADNYIVAIDNSGSMLTSDPDYKRYEALAELFKQIEQNQTLGVYVFNDDYKNAFESQNIKQEHIQNFDEIFKPYIFSESTTDVMKLLNHIADDIQTKPLKGNTNIIIISDGECEVDPDILKKLNDLNIPTHTIGVYKAGLSSSLHKISRQTGGAYFNIENIDNIIKSLKGIASYSFEQSIIGYRGGYLYSDILYMLMRIVFIFLIVFSIKSIQMLVIDIAMVRKLLFIESITFSILAGVISEFMFQKTDLQEQVIRYVLVLCITIILIPVYDTKIKSLDEKYFDEQSSFTSFKNSVGKVESKNKIK